MSTRRNTSKYRNRSKAFSKIGESIAALANYTVRSLTQSRIPVQPIGSSPEISQEIKTKPTSVNTDGVKITFDTVTFGTGKKRKTNKNIKRIKKHAQQ